MSLVKVLWLDKIFKSSKNLINLYFYKSNINLIVFKIKICSNLKYKHIIYCDIQPLNFIYKN